MHDIDAATSPAPKQPVNPVMDPTTDPVTPVPLSGLREEPMTTTTTRFGNPMPYVAVLVLGVLGTWGVMTMENRRPPSQEGGAYVEQTLEPASTMANGRAMDAGTPLMVTASRVNDDRRTDSANGLSRDQMERATEADRIDETAMPASEAAPSTSYDNEVASVDLMENAPVADTSLVEDRKTSAGVVPAASPSTVPIQVIDLDYSQRPMVAMTEPEVKNEMKLLDKDLDQSEMVAEELGQKAALDVLERRYEALEDSAEATVSPMAEADRLHLTRLVKQLRDEVTAFQRDLENRVGAR